jgi:hypothetical protein
MRVLTATLVGLALWSTLTLPAAAGLAALAAGGVAPAVDPLSGLHASGSVSSQNWAGYAATGAAGSVTRIAAKWVEPTVNCTARTSLAAFWVGIDGYGSGTVEQTGTLAECIGGTASYYAWWELYPTNSVQIFAAIHAGDAFNGSVSYHPSTGTFALRLTDVTTLTTYTTNQTLASANESSAECIAEAPSGGAGIYPLANFHHVVFSSCDATIGGKTHPIGAYTSVMAITMVSQSNPSRVLASVTGLRGSTGFRVVWHHAS